MEATRTEKTRLGIFFIAIISLLVVSVLFLVGGKLFVRTDEYFTRMEESVTGLRPGSAVKQNGLDVGKILSIRSDSADVRRTLVHFGVARGTPMKADMTASLGSYGITGLKYLEITGGSYGAADIAPGGEIPSRLSMVGRLAFRADSIAYKVDRLLGNVIAITDMDNRENLNRMMAASAGLAETLDSMLIDLQGVNPGRRVDALLGGLESTLVDFRATIRNSDVDSLVHDYRLVAADIRQVATNLDITVRRTQEDLLVSMSDLRETLRNMSSFSRQIRETPSVLLRREDRQERR